MLDLENINSYYGSSHVLHDISLTVEEGSFVTLIGRNGAGKTTTLKSIMGMVKPRTGTISFEDENITGLEPYQISKRGISIVPEERGLFSELTVLENLKLGYLGHDIDRDPDEARELVYKYFPRLKEREKQRAGQMSGGEQQMLAIARGLISDPEFLLIDEPTEGLMPTLVDELGELLIEINDDGVTILLVEQNVNLALEISEQGYIIDEGEIKQQGPSGELLKNQKIIDKYLAV